MQIPLLKRWHPMLAMRYLPVVDKIDENESVLEVGSGSLGIGPYLKRPFTGADVDFSGPTWPKMERVKASATELPFRKNEFDVVISMDMLEHLDKGVRGKAISQMMKVANKKLIIGVPIGGLAHQQDIELDRIYEERHGKRHQFLKEQTEYGLPEKKEIVGQIKTAAKDNGKKVTIKIEKNMNLIIRKWLMKGWISKNPITNIFFRKVLLLFIPILKKLNHEPVYRLIFVADLK
jgi:hypothetical protein